MDRIPQVMWRGRTVDPEFPDRDALRWAFFKSNAAGDRLSPCMVWRAKG